MQRGAIIAALFVSVMTVVSVVFLTMFWPRKEVEQRPSINTVTPDDPRSAMIVADSLRSQAEFQRALDEYTSAKKMSRKSEAWDAFTNASVGIARVTGEMGRYNTARLELLQTMKVVSRKASVRDITLADLHSQLGRMLVRLDRFDEAEQHLGVALSLVHSSPTRSIMVEGLTLQALGLLYHFQGNYDRALDLYERSFSVLSLLNGSNSVKATIPMNNIANIYYRKGLFVKALEIHKRVLNTRETWLRKDHPLTAMSFGNIGNVLYAMGDYESSLNYHRKAASIWSESFGPVHPELAASYNNMGRSLTALHRYEEAYSILQKSLAQKIELLGTENDRTAISYGAVGEVNFHMGHFDTARQWLLRSIHVWEDKNLLRHTSYWSALRNLALVSAATERRGEALELLSKVLALSSRTPHPFSTKLLNDLAEIKFSDTDPAQKLAAINRSIQVNTSTTIEADGSTNPPIHGALDSQELLRSFRLKIALMRGWPEKQGSHVHLTYAFETLLRASDLIDKIWREKLSDGSMSFLDEMAARIHGEAIEIALDLYAQTNEKRYLDLAFHFAEKRKSRRLIESIADSDARQLAGVDTALIARDTAFRLKINYEKRRIAELFASESRDSLEVAHSRDLLFESERNYSLFSRAVALRFPKYYSMRHGVATISISKIQGEILDEDTALVEYVLHDTTMTTFVITNDSIHVRRAKIPADFDSSIDSLRIAIKQRLDRDYVRLSIRTYKTLLELLEPVLKASKLIIIPEGKIGLVPFEALLTEPVVSASTKYYSLLFSQLPYLIRQKSISYAYSTTLLNQSMNRKHEKTKNNLFAVAPAFPRGMELDSTTIEFLNLNGYDTSATPFSIAPLPGSEEEVEHIGAIFRKREGFVRRWFDSKSTVLLHDNATESAVKSPALSSYKYLHFASHSFSSPVDPSLSGMLLRPGGRTDKEDGILRAGEIFSLKLNAELVVLSACDTGVDVQSGTEGITSLSRGFIYAGAKNLIVSLWPSDDAGTKYLMIELYENLAPGKDIKTALRDAKLTLIKEGGIIARPLFWSPFVEIGN